MNDATVETSRYIAKFSVRTWQDFLGAYPMHSEFYLNIELIYHH